MFQKKTIQQQIMMCVGPVVGLTAVLAVISVCATLWLSGIFSDYRQQARQTKTIAALADDVSTIRREAFRYRIQPTDAKMRTITETLNLTKERTLAAKALFSENTDARQTFTNLEAQMNTYANAAQELHTVTTQIATVSDAVDGLYDQSVTEINSLASMAQSDIQSALISARYHYALHKANPDSDGLRESQGLVSKAIGDLGKLAESSGGTDRASQFSSLLAGFKQLNALQSDLGALEAARQSINTETLDKIGPDVQAQYAELLASASQQQDEIGPRGAKAITLSLVLVVLSGLAAVASGIILARKFGRRISDAIRSMANVMEKVAGGDLGLKVEGTDNQNELGQMARALIVFQDTGVEAQRLAEETEAAQKEQQRLEAEKAEQLEQDRKRKDAETAAELERQKRLEQQVLAFTSEATTLIANFTAGSNQLQSVADRMAVVADETKQQSTTAANASSEATSSVSGIASASEELTASFKDVAIQVGNASKLAETAASDTEKTGKIIQGLAASAEQISGVVNMIHDIAEQTNLLALNATIEAARAGEAGRGFAIVANEVKSLATQTAKATAEITDHVEGIQKVTHDAVGSMTTIRKGVTAIDTAATAVSAAADEQTVVTQEISESVQRAVTGSQQATESIAHVSEQASDTGVVAGEVQQASEALNADADRLSKLVDGFVNDLKAA